MFNQTWKKYIPVITILLKRSTTDVQSLSMNHTDFERAAGGRKMKWSFPVLQVNNGRIQNNGTKYPALATEMITELQMDEQTSKLLQKQEFEFSMSNDFKLLIKNISALPQTEDDDATGAEEPIEETVID